MIEANEIKDVIEGRLGSHRDSRFPGPVDTTRFVTGYLRFRKAVRIADPNTPELFSLMAYTGGIIMEDPGLSERTRLLRATGHIYAALAEGVDDLCDKERSGVEKAWKEKQSGRLSPKDLYEIGLRELRTERPADYDILERRFESARDGYLEAEQRLLEMGEGWRGDVGGCRKDPCSVLRVGLSIKVNGFSGLGEAIMQAVSPERALTDGARKKLENLVLTATVIDDQKDTKEDVKCPSLPIGDVMEQCDRMRGNPLSSTARRLVNHYSQDLPPGVNGAFQMAVNGVLISEKINQMRTSRNR